MTEERVDGTIEWVKPIDKKSKKELQEELERLRDENKMRESEIQRLKEEKLRQEGAISELRIQLANERRKEPTYWRT